MWTVMKSLFVCVFRPRLKPHPNAYWWWWHQKPPRDRKSLLRECNSDVFDESNSSQGVGSKSFLPLMWEGPRQEWLVPAQHFLKKSSQILITSVENRWCVPGCRMQPLDTPFSKIVKAKLMCLSYFSLPSMFVTWFVVQTAGHWLCQFASELIVWWGKV